jgi:hypothetical protein
MLYGRSVDKRASHGVRDASGSSLGINRRNGEEKRMVVILDEEL